MANRDEVESTLLVYALPIRRRKILLCVLTVFAVLAVGMGALYEHWVGFPRKIAGHWVHPRVTWYWTWYPPLGYPYPAIVQYVYADEHGREIKHGPPDAFVSLLRSDPTLHMPPWRAWFSGRSAVRAFLTQAWQGYGGFRARVFRANGRSAIAVYACMANDDAWRPHSVHVLEVSEGAVASIVAFVGPLGRSLFSNTGLPLRSPKKPKPSPPV